MLAGLIGTHNRELALGSKQRHIARFGSLIVEIHRDAGICKAHHRAHTHACSHDSIGTCLLKQANGAQTAAFFMRRIVDYRRALNLTVLDFEQREIVTVTEMTGALRLGTALPHRRNCKFHASSSCMHCRAHAQQRNAIEYVVGIVRPNATRLQTFFRERSKPLRRVVR